MKLRNYVLLAALLLPYYNVGAQIFTSVIDEDALQFRVKQIDEFFVRFNYETDYKGDNPRNPSDKKERRKNMLTLINLDKFTNENKDVDSTANRFLDYVIGKDIKIHYEDTTWNAEAKGSFMYEGKKHDVTFVLKTERIKGVIFKWVIADVQSSLFKQFLGEPKDTITISPAEHGINFMTLPETFNLNKSAVGTTFAKGYRRNNLVIFDYLSTIGKIRMNPITKVCYHFHLSNVDFDVERIEKGKSYNQGWLINNITFEKESHDKK